MLSTPAVDEFGFYILTSPFGTVAEILVASFGVRVGASNDLLSAPAIVAPGLEPRDRLLDGAGEVYPTRAYNASGALPSRWTQIEGSQSPPASPEEEGLTDPPS